MRPEAWAPEALPVLTVRHAAPRRRRLPVPVLGLLLAGLGSAAVAAVGISMASTGPAGSPRPLSTTSTRPAREARPLIGARTAQAVLAPTPAAPTPTPPGPYGVVGLGDSVPSGAACSCNSFVTLVAQSLALRQHLPEPAVNLALPGQTSAGLLAQLAVPATLTALAGSDVALVTVGANDFDATLVSDDPCSTPSATGCYGDDLAELGIRLGTILHRVRAAMPPGGRVLVTGYWNVFLDGQVGAAYGTSYVANSDALTRAVNAVVASAAGATGARYVDLYAAFKGGGRRDDTSLLAVDGDHPNAAGHQVIAKALIAALA